MNQKQIIWGMNSVGRVHCIRSGKYNLCLWGVEKEILSGWLSNCNQEQVTQEADMQKFQISWEKYEEIE